MERFSVSRRTNEKGIGEPRGSKGNADAQERETRALTGALTPPQKRHWARGLPWGDTFLDNRPRAPKRVLGKMSPD